MLSWGHDAVQRGGAVWGSGIVQGVVPSGGIRPVLPREQNGRQV